MRTPVRAGWLKRHPIAAALLLLCIFAGCGVYTTVRSQNYLTIVWNISKCKWKPPYEGYIMVGCPSVMSSFYRTGALFLGVDKRMVDALRRADLIVTGNSTTIETFMLEPKNNQLDAYFTSKGLKYYILAQEGSGFRFRKLLAENLGLKPRISVIDTDDVFADIVNDWNRDLVLNPDRFKVPFMLTYWAIELQHQICRRAEAMPAAARSWVLTRLEAFYCHGDHEPEWLNLENGSLLLNIPRTPTNRVQIVEGNDAQLKYMDLYTRRAVQVLETTAWKRSCIILYVVPSPGGSIAVGRRLAQTFHLPFVFPSVAPEKNYWSFDNSHMELDTAIRWTKEFIPFLDFEVDKCLKQGRGASRPAS